MGAQISKSVDERSQGEQCSEDECSEDWNTQKKKRAWKLG